MYQGPGGVWCDVDVVEFSYFGAPEPVPKEQLYTEIVDDLRGGDPCIGSGSQVFPYSLNLYFLCKDSSSLQKITFDSINIAYR